MLLFSFQKLKHSSNDQLMNLYKPTELPTTANNFQKGNGENAELIDISSDDENVKSSEEDENATGAGKNNAVQNHSNIKETPLISPRKATNKAGEYCLLVAANILQQILVNLYSFF